MLRKGVVRQTICLNRKDELPEFLQNYYNKVVVTNKTIKQPYNCSSNHGNKKSCSICSIKPKSRKSSRLYKKKNLINENY